MEELWKLAASQHALFARWQARAFGLTWRHLDTRLRRGDIEHWSDDVFRLCGAPRTLDQAVMGGVLDGGPGSIATKRTSGWIWGVPGMKPGHLDIIRGRGQRSQSSATSRWPRNVPPHHVTSVRGIPVLTLARTMFELFGMPECAPWLPRAIDTIDGRTPALLVAMHEMLPEVAQRGKAGITFARETLAARPPDRVRLTGMERRFEWDLTSAGIPIPRRQVDLGGHSWIGRVDYYDDAIKVIYEIDSDLHHRSLLDQLNDERRDAEAAAAGFNEVVRIKEEDVWYDPGTVRRIVVATRRKYGWRQAA